MRKEREQMLLPEALRMTAIEKSNCNNVEVVKLDRVTHPNAIAMEASKRNSLGAKVDECGRQESEVGNMLCGTKMKMATKKLVEETPRKAVVVPNSPGTIWNPYKKRLQVAVVRSPTAFKENQPKRMRAFNPPEELFNAFRDSKATFNNCTFIIGNQSE